MRHAVKSLTSFQALVCLMLALPWFGAWAEVKLDGEISEGEWQGAQEFTSFVQSFPNTGGAPKYPTKTYLLTDEKGLYISFENYQPSRSRSYSGHDQYTSADFNMVFVDFNGDGDTAYEFVATLGGGTMDGTYSRGNQSNRDWDGQWQVRVSEQGDYWYSEFFIPWTIATYQDVTGPTREIAVYFQRQNVIDSQAYSFPDTHRGRKNFTYEFAPVTVSNEQSQSLTTKLYLADRYDLLDKENQVDAGLDLIWKPTADQQLIATINPDFGQVESDELIVNYSAVETLRTDKRPFFTENQSLFDVQGPNNLKLLNTRRIGANAELDTSQVHDIKAAGKYIRNGSGNSAGLLFAEEGDAVSDDGKQFLSGRWYATLDTLTLGQLYNLVRNPVGNRESFVFNQDMRFMPNDEINLAANFLYSNIRDDVDNTEGKGATLKMSYVPVRHWQNNLEWTYLDDELDINDFGYQQRNNISTLTLDSRYDDYQLPKDSAILRTRAYVKYSGQRNTQGLYLRDNWYTSYFIRLKSRHNFRLGLDYHSQGADDLITRQIGHVERAEQKNVHFYYATPTPAALSFSGTYHRLQEGQSDWAHKLLLNTRAYFTDSVRLDLNYTYIDSDDWLIGNSQGQVQRYRRKMNKAFAKLVSKIDETSDFTLTSQWVGLKAYGRSTQNEVFVQGDDFNLSQFSLQARYRKKFASGSSFYLVYSHNGFDSEETNQIGFDDMLSSAIANPTQKRITAKFNWLF